MHRPVYVNYYKHKRVMVGRQAARRIAGQIHHVPVQIVPGALRPLRRWDGLHNTIIHRTVNEILIQEQSLFMLRSCAALIRSCSDQSFLTSILIIGCNAPALYYNGQRYVSVGVNPEFSGLWRAFCAACRSF